MRATHTSRLVMSLRLLACITSLSFDTPKHIRIDGSSLAFHPANIHNIFYV